MRNKPSVHLCSHCSEAVKLMPCRYWKLNDINDASHVMLNCASYKELIFESISIPNAK